MVYDESRSPKNAAEWDEPRFIHKTHWGYYTWPEKMLVYAPQAEQPPLDRNVEDMNEVEQELVKFFLSSESVEKLLKYLSLEEQKGRDRFDSRRFTMFKGLFRNFGDVVLQQMKPILERLIDEGTESGHRCVAEIVAGLIRGSKHWPYDKTEALWAWLVPVLRNAMDKVSVETIGDWGTCFATASESRDPNRMHWMMEVLMEEPLQSRGAFMDSSRLYVLQGAIAQQEWRAGKMLHRLMDFLKPYCSHPYQAVRDRMGSVLTNVFLNDLHFADKAEAANKRSPRIADFIAEVVPLLEVLTEEPDPEVLKQNLVTPGSAQAGPPGVPPVIPPSQIRMPPPGGVMPLGAIPPGAVPPGIIMIPPGAIPPGAIPPGVIPPGVVPPGAIPPGAIPPGAIPPGAIPPGVIPPGAIPPGVIPPGLLSRLPGPPPPELLARLAAAPPAEALAGLAGALPPELLAQLSGGNAQEAISKLVGALPQGGGGMVVPGGIVPGGITLPGVPVPGMVENGQVGSPEYQKRQEAIRLGQTGS
jgi:hypothetical protein